ncbi:MAG: hypothetical protein U0871_04645 [Gemmataceae bacterium]
MPFADHLTVLPPHIRLKLDAWWAAVQCNRLRANFDAINLFPAPGTPKAIDALTRFANALQSLPGDDPKRAAKLALDGDPCILCCGPQTKPSGPLCRLHSATTLVGRHFRPSFPSTNPNDLARYVRTRDDFETYVDPSRGPLRGTVPVLFWSTELEIRAHCAANRPQAVVTLRQALGLDPDDPTPGVVLRLDDPHPVAFIPNGFDAFDHPFYSAVPGSYQDPPPCGRTRHTGSAGQDGVSEFVTPPQEVNQVTFVMTVE